MNAVINDCLVFVR